MLCPLPQTALTGLSVNPGCALPGDALNSVLDTSFGENAAALGTKQPTSSSVSGLELQPGCSDGGDASLSCACRAVESGLKYTMQIHDIP